MKTGKKRQATLFGMQVAAHNQYVSNPTSNYEHFMNKYLSRSNDNKTRQLVVDKEIRQWNEKFKGTFSFN